MAAARPTIRPVVASRSGPYLAFRKRLRSARVDAGLSQAQTARRLGKQQSFVSKCESGERRVDVVELRRFARVYGVAFGYFFGDARAVAEPAGGYEAAPLTPARLIGALAEERASLERSLRALPADDRFGHDLLAAHRDLVARQLADAEARSRGRR